MKLKDIQIGKTYRLKNPDGEGCCTGFNDGQRVEIRLPWGAYTWVDPSDVVKEVAEARAVSEAK